MLTSQFLSATDDDTFTSDKIKRIFYQSMPLCWRTNFVNSGQIVQQVSIEVLRTYMVQQELQTDAHIKKVRETSKKQSKTPFDKNKGFKHN